MPIEVRWYTPEHDIIELQFQGKWNWEELAECMTEVFAMMRSVPHPVDRIINFLGSGPLPVGALENVMPILQGSPANWGCTAIVQTTPFLPLLFKTFVRLQPRYASRYFMTRSLVEAEAAIAQYRTRHTRR